MVRNLILAVVVVFSVLLSFVAWEQRQHIRELNLSYEIEVARQATSSCGTEFVVSLSNGRFAIGGHVVNTTRGYSARKLDDGRRAIVYIDEFIGGTEEIVAVQDLSQIR